jgi:hypothetical protein
VLKNSAASPEVLVTCLVENINVSLFHQPKIVTIIFTWAVMLSVHHNRTKVWPILFYGYARKSLEARQWLKSIFWSKSWLRISPDVQTVHCVIVVMNCRNKVNGIIMRSSLWGQKNYAYNDICNVPEKRFQSLSLCKFPECILHYFARKVLTEDFLAE